MYEYSFIISKTKKNIPTGSDESTIMASYFPSGVFRINSTAVQIPQYQISNLKKNKEKKHVMGSGSYHQRHGDEHEDLQNQQLTQENTSYYLKLQLQTKSYIYMMSM